MSKDTTIKSITFFHGIVNWCKYVEKIKEKTIIVNGEEIPVSARLIKSKIKKEYSQYCKENARFC